MKVKGLFFCMDGVVRAENLPVNKREIEFIDGAHPILPSAIYHDVDLKGPPIYICWHGLPFPQGVAPSFEQEKGIIKEAVHMTQHKMKTLISKRWYRLLVQGFIIFLKALMIGFLVGVGLLILLAVIH